MFFLFFPAELQDYGWKRSNGSLEVVWEVPENVAKVQARLEFAFDGCSCRVTGCTTCRCKCIKKGKICGPACRCLNCHNTRVYDADLKLDDAVQELEIGDVAREHQMDEELVDDSDFDEDLDERMRADEDLTTIMDFVFGSDSDEDDFST